MESFSNKHPEILLEARNICYTYENEHRYALENVSVKIRQGKKIACIGLNGSGKSTFFLCCNGIFKPESGQMYYRGIPFDYSRKGLLNLRQNVGIVFQDPDRQLFSASVLQEISFGPLNLGFSQAETLRKVTAVMQQLGISSFSQKPTHALSGGQKKLVAIADILVMEPELVIFDEPTASLDLFHTQLIHEIIDTITSQGTTVISATHDIDYAFEWADEILLFHNGEIVKQFSPHPEEKETVKQFLLGRILL